MIDVIDNAIALAGICLWVGCLAFATVDQLKGENWLKFTISHYLVGLDGFAVELGFYALAISLFALAATVPTLPALFYFLGGLGTAGAAVTRAVWPDQRWHIRSAGVAFGGIGCADLLASFGHPALLALAIAAPVVALIDLQWRSNTAIQEKSVALLYVAWVGVVTIGRLSGHALV